MCNLYDIGPSPNEDRFDWEGVVREAVKNLTNDYVAPGKEGVVAHQVDGIMVASVMRWGFRRKLETKGKLANRDINNARSEKISGRMWSPSWTEHRCLIPMRHFYEWSGRKGAKTKHRIWADDHEHWFWVAGIWESSANAEMPSYSLITTTANPQMEPIHHRMPVILRNADCLDYLSQTEPPTHLLQPFPEKLTIDPPVIQELELGLDF
tara:strand:+ start:2699 stop:3325 length:627 start_codon:yes stop_codon:yes gene_type:complete